MAHYRKSKGHAYRIESTRLPGWDYRSAAYYFVTICTKDHRCCLAKIADGVAYISPLGMIVAEEWWRTPHVRPYVKLDASQIMPNHFHGIIVIEESEMAPQEEQGTGALHLQAGSLGAIIGQFKSICTKRIRALGDGAFQWQPRFHDHIIRDENELKRLRAYIVGNPGKWYEDRYYRAE